MNIDICYVIPLVKTNGDAPDYATDAGTGMQAALADLNPPDHGILRGFSVDVEMPRCSMVEHIDIKVRPAKSGPALEVKLNLVCNPGQSGRHVEYVDAHSSIQAAIELIGRSITSAIGHDSFEYVGSVLTVSPGGRMPSFKGNVTVN